MRYELIFLRAPAMSRIRGADVQGSAKMAAEMCWTGKENICSLRCLLSRENLNSMFPASFQENSFPDSADNKYSEVKYKMVALSP